MFKETIKPLLSKSVQDEVDSLNIDWNSNDEDEKLESRKAITEILKVMYDSMDDEDKQDLIDEIDDAMYDYNEKISIEQRKTIIHRIEIDNGNIEYKVKGEVEGYLLNQFSLSEYDNNLRVATTTYMYNRDGSKMYNNIFVLNEDLEEIGSIEELAENERIYSARFMGKKLYLVTFERIDPLFVIDLSNAQNPKVLGKLKIPGYSDYLHPYDENYIIGIGKETDDGNGKDDRVEIKGLKLALFDVSDVENPVAVDKYEIGLTGSSSEALNEHKAFLFDKEKNLLVLPVREVKEESYYDAEENRWINGEVWQGAYVFNLDEKGFDLKGKVTHIDDKDKNDNNYYGYYYYSSDNIRRSIFMDNVLYTISNNIIKMNDLDTLDEINKIEIDKLVKINEKDREVYPVLYN